MATKEVQLIIGGKTKRSRWTKEVVVGFDDLPEASREFIIRYGLKQYIADGTASAETEAQFVGGIETRIAKLKAADFTRTRGETKAKPDTETSRATALVRAEIKKRLAAANLTADKDKIAEAVKAVMDSETAREPFMAEAKRQLAQEAKMSAPDDVMAGLLAELVGAKDEPTVDSAA